jgi:hypothetical protein
VGARWFAVVAVIVAFAPAARGDETTAQAAFRQAEELAKQGKWADACPFYEASYKADQQIGVLLHLADCHEKIGRTATAWSEFSDAVELAQRRGDNRAAYAQTRVDALAPKLARLRIVRPAKPIPGLVVRRDGADVTVLVGTDMPIDPGDHEIVVSVPGFAEARVMVKIEDKAKTTPLELPTFKADAAKPVETKPGDGTLSISSQPDAEILLDNGRVGTGRFDGPVKPGRHTLRVTAPGTRAYQTEIVVLEGERRSIDVPTLEREVIAAPSGPGWELGFGVAPGVKGHGDHPAEVALRIDLGKRIGSRVNFGVYVETAGINTNGSCGTDIAGPTPSTPFDFGPRNQFNKCFYLMAGLQLYVHILPARTWDPWIAVTPGFRDAVAKYTPFSPSNPMSPTASNGGGDMLGITTTLRAGADYRASRGLAVGAFAEVQIWVTSDEFVDLGGKATKGSAQYASFFAGVRSSLAF